MFLGESMTHAGINMRLWLQSRRLTERRKRLEPGSREPLRSPCPTPSSPMAWGKHVRITPPGCV